MEHERLAFGARRDSRSLESELANVARDLSSADSRIATGAHPAAPPGGRAGGARLRQLTAGGRAAGGPPPEIIVSEARGVKAGVQHEGHPLWDPDAQRQRGALMACDASTAVLRAAYRGDLGAMRGVGVSAEQAAECAAAQAEPARAEERLAAARRDLETLVANEGHAERVAEAEALVAARAAEVERAVAEAARWAAEMEEREARLQRLRAGGGGGGAPDTAGSARSSGDPAAEPRPYAAPPQSFAPPGAGGNAGPGEVTEGMERVARLKAAREAQDAADMAAHPCRALPARHQVNRAVNLHARWAPLALATAEDDPGPARHLLDVGARVASPARVTAARKGRAELRALQRRRHAMGRDLDEGKKVPRALPPPRSGPYRSNCGHAGQTPG